MKSNKQHEKVLQVLIATPGKVVTKEELTETLAGQVELYRLPTYIWGVRKLGANVEVVKDGKKVVAYKVTNPEKFKNYFADKEREQSVPVTVKSAIAPKSKTETVAKAAAVKATPSEPVELNTGAVPYSVDEDFDAIDISDFL